MYIQPKPADYKSIKRHDGIFQEKVPDSYKVRRKPQKPAVCPQCNAVFQAGHWRWGNVPANARQQVCPACHRMNENYPAGFVTLEGDLFMAHRDEIMHLLHHHEQREGLEHPLQRIMAVEPHEKGVLVTTTDVHLARGIGEAIHHAYQGRLEYHYHSGENLLRVRWTD